MGTPGEQQPAASAAANGTCGECGHTDDTVRDLGLKIRYALCDPCFAELTAIRTVAEVLPVSRVLDDVLTGMDPLEAGRRSHTWRRNAPESDEPGPAGEPREDQSA
ncbi:MULTISPECIES: hypothetical protein [Streptomyces]|uniref:Uncharacterized protein n=1 Tax=Streptomyces mordarskii TaxID=1226758 RepID=A0ABN1DWQ3_9ACTN